MKLCKTCKHGTSSTYGPFGLCARSVRVIKIDLQNGNEIIGGWRYTTKERKPGRIMARLTGMCGKEGRFWEANP